MSCSSTVSVPTMILAGEFSRFPDLSGPIVPTHKSDEIHPVNGKLNIVRRTEGSHLGYRGPKTLYRPDSPQELSKLA